MDEWAPGSSWAPGKTCQIVGRPWPGAKNRNGKEFKARPNIQSINVKGSGPALGGSMGPQPQAKGRGKGPGIVHDTLK